MIQIELGTSCNHDFDFCGVYGTDYELQDCLEIFFLAFDGKQPGRMSAFARYLPPSQRIRANRTSMHSTRTCGAVVGSHGARGTGGGACGGSKA